MLGGKDKRKRVILRVFMEVEKSAFEKRVGHSYFGKICDS